MYKAGEEIKVYGENGGNTHLKEGNCADDAGNPSENQRGKTGQCSVNNAHQHRAARHVTDVTEGHRDGVRDFADDVHWRHYYDRLGEALEPCLEAEIFDIGVPNESRGGERPSQGNREVARGGNEDLRHTDQRTEERGEKERTDVRGKFQIMLAHRALHETVEHIDKLFDHNLQTTGTLFYLSRNDKGRSEQQNLYRLYEDVLIHLILFLHIIHL